MILKNFKYKSKVGDTMIDSELLQEVKRYARLDDTGDKEWDTLVNEEVKILILSAEKFLWSHGVKKDYENELYKIAIFMLVSIWYDNRGLGEQAREIPFGVTRIIRQLNIMNDYGTI